MEPDRSASITEGVAVKSGSAQVDNPFNMSTPSVVESLLNRCCMDLHELAQLV